MTVQVRTFEQLHRVIRAALVDAEVFDAHDVRVRELRELRERAVLLMVRTLQTSQCFANDWRSVRTLCICAPVVDTPEDA
jgi:hypothetical protein